MADKFIGSLSIGIAMVCGARIVAFIASVVLT